MILSDPEINSLINEPKIWTGRQKINSKTENRYLRAEKTLDTVSGNIFSIFIRRLKDDPLGFSVGLVFKDKTTGEEARLIRCNGFSHSHNNRLEKERLNYIFHIHKATNRYMELGLTAEKWAYETNKYNDLETALKYFVDLVNISPIPFITKPSYTKGLF